MTEDSGNVKFENRPIIVLGVNHSGTRAVVDMLSVLGSDGGDCNNQWRENELFLDLHRNLLNVNSQEQWTKRIFDITTYNTYRPDKKVTDIVIKKLEDRLPDSYPTHNKVPWHWKCPTSSLFINFWLDVYPDAFYIHIVRDPLDVTGSLLRRNQFGCVNDALKFYEAMEKPLRNVQAKNYLRIDYDQLKNEIPRLLEFLPFLDKSKANHAGELIHGGFSVWKKGASLRDNLVNLRIEAIIKFAKFLRKFGMYKNISHSKKIL